MDYVLFILALIRFESIKICQLIATVLCGVLSGLMGIRTKTAAVASITLYYLFRTFTYGSLAVFAAECFPVSIKIPCPKPSIIFFWMSRKPQNKSATAQPRFSWCCKYSKASIIQIRMKYQASNYSIRVFELFQACKGWRMCTYVFKLKGAVETISTN